MGHYTEFSFRARITDKPATAEPIVDWLDQSINGELGFAEPFDNHPFFSLPRWIGVFIGGGAVYQYSSRPKFRRSKHSFEGNWLAIHSSLKDYGGETEAFIDWITPHLDMHYGDFLGYSLYEDSCDDEELYREHPTLYFYGREPARG